VRIYTRCAISIFKNFVNVFVDKKKKEMKGWRIPRTIDINAVVSNDFIMTLWEFCVGIFFFTTDAQNPPHMPEHDIHMTSTFIRKYKDFISITKHLRPNVSKKHFFLLLSNLNLLLNVLDNTICLI